MKTTVKTAPYSDVIARKRPERKKPKKPMLLELTFSEFSRDISLLKDTITVLLAAVQALHREEI